MAYASRATARTPNEWVTDVNTASPFDLELVTVRRSTRSGLLYRPLRADRPGAGRSDLNPNRPLRAEPAPIPAKRAHGLGQERRTRVTQGCSPVTNVTSSNGVIRLDPNEILTKRELAKRLKVSVRSIENLHLPCLDMGYRLKRYVWSEVMANLRQRRNGRDNTSR